MQHLENNYVILQKNNEEIKYNNFYNSGLTKYHNFSNCMLIKDDRYQTLQMFL